MAWAAAPVAVAERERALAEASEAADAALADAAEAADLVDMMRLDCGFLG